MINVQRDRLTASQIAIFIWGFSILLAAGLFFQFIQRPAHLQVLKIKDKVDLLESHLRWVTQTIDTIRDPEKVFEYFMVTDRDLMRKFPDSVEKSLIGLAEYANKFGVRVDRIQAQNPRPVVNARGGPLGADGKVCMGVEVSFKFKSEYDNLVKYIDALRKVLPAFVVVRKMTVENNFSAESRVEGQLDLSLYLLE